MRRKPSRQRAGRLSAGVLFRSAALAGPFTGWGKAGPDAGSPFAAGRRHAGNWEDNAIPPQHLTQTNWSVCSTYEHATRRFRQA
jgi:hypothetical protein